MRTETGAWPVLRTGWTGTIPKIFAGQSTEKIFLLACRPGGATIPELLALRKESGKSQYVKVAALVKLLNEIENAYLVKLIENGGSYTFKRID